MVVSHACVGEMNVCFGHRDCLDQVSRIYQGHGTVERQGSPNATLHRVSSRIPDA